MQALHIVQSNDDYKNVVVCGEFYDGNFPEDVYQQHLFKREDITISDLPDSERDKVSRLVDKLVSLGREQEELVADLAYERSRHANEIETSSQLLLKCQSEFGQEREKLKEQLAEVQAKHRSGLRLLHLYQVSLENFVKDNGALKDALVTRAVIIDGSSKQNSGGRNDSGESISEQEFRELVPRLEAFTRTQQAIIDATQSANAKLAAENQVAKLELISCRVALSLADESLAATKKQLAALIETHSAAPQELQNESSMEMACEGMARQLAEMAAKVEERNSVIKEMRVQIQQHQQQQQGHEHIVQHVVMTEEGARQAASPLHLASVCLPPTTEMLGTPQKGRERDRQSVDDVPDFINSALSTRSREVGESNFNHFKEEIDSNSNSSDVVQRWHLQSRTVDSSSYLSFGDKMARHTVKTGDRIDGSTSRQLRSRTDESVSDADSSRDRDRSSVSVSWGSRGTLSKSIRPLVEDDVVYGSNSPRDRAKMGNEGVLSSSKVTALQAHKDDDVSKRSKNKDKDKHKVKHSEPMGGSKDVQPRNEHSTRQHLSSSSSSSSAVRSLNGLGPSLTNACVTLSPSSHMQQNARYRPAERQSRLHSNTSTRSSRTPSIASVPTPKERDKEKIKKPLGEEIQQKRRVLAFDSERDEYDPHLFKLLHDLESQS